MCASWFDADHSGEADYYIHEFSNHNFDYEYHYPYDYFDHQWHDFDHHNYNSADHHYY